MHYIHKVVITDKGTIILIDVCDTWDNGIEGAYAFFDKATFEEQWSSICEEEDTPYSIEDIQEWGEDLESFTYWTVVSGNHRSADAALRNVMKAIKYL